MKTVRESFTKVKEMDKKSQFGSLVSGVLIGYAVTCVVFIFYSILITYTSVSEQNIPLVVTATTLISVIVAGFDAAKGAEDRGWLWGIGAGFIYAVVLVAIMTWINKGFSPDTRTITVIILAVAGGGLGGVVGINFK